MSEEKQQKSKKTKKDSFRLLLRFVIIIAAITLACFGIIHLCDGMIVKELADKQNEVQQINEKAEEEFNEMLAQASASSVSTVPSAQTEEQTVEENLQTWNVVLDGVEWRVEDMGSAGIENASSITLERSQLMNGGLLLINAWHAIPDDFSEEGLVTLSTYSKQKQFPIQVEDNTVKLFSQAADALIEALTAAKADGLDYYIVREGYRSVADQQEIYNEKLQKYSSKYSGTRLTEEVKKLVNYPGTSDYHSGLSFRMDVYQSGNSQLNSQKFQKESEQGKWLTKNCWRYGIIFRFPSKDFPDSTWSDKSYITGVSSQLNLYRYVGKAHSVAMKLLDFCLEEYIDFLIDHPHICIFEDGSLKYEIIRMTGADNASTYTLPKPNLCSDFTGSLDNMNGIVMAYTYD